MEGGGGTEEGGARRRGGMRAVRARGCAVWKCFASISISASNPSPPLFLHVIFSEPSCLCLVPIGLSPLVPLPSSCQNSLLLRLSLLVFPLHLLPS